MVEVRREGEKKMIWNPARSHGFVVKFYFEVMVSWMQVISFHEGRFGKLENC